jgi:YidC/Oxa1 family membrane protein insertase
MDSKRLVIFILISLGLLLVWDKYIVPKPSETISSAANQVPNSSNSEMPSAKSNNQINSDTSVLKNDKMVTVTTDTLQVEISTIGGDLRSVNLLKHGSLKDIKLPFDILYNTNNKVFVAQTGLINNTGIILPTHNTIFTPDKLNYVLAPNEKKLTVSLKAIESGIEVIKNYTFSHDSYTVDVSYQIINNTGAPLTGISAYWRLLRDETAPDGETMFVHTFTGPAYYTSDAKFNTVKFSDVAKNSVSYPDTAMNGWIGYIQHYFTAMWLLSAYNHDPVCSNGVACRLNFKQVGQLASAGVMTDLPAIKPNSSYSITVPLFIGPQDHKVLIATAPELELTKDYGFVYIFATPLFWLLVKLYELVKNWGWAIILLTLVVKTVLYPLTRASYISMAKMKALAPKLETLKAQYGDDKVRLQKAMMELYKSEKVNPIGGCLPMILQIPVFIGLYWALLSSVELRQAGFLWVNDLSLPDPYYILPVILAITMFLQTYLNPPPTDPVQAKMMKIMPLAFSVMFFFFPAGLVLYWLVNNILSMAQQWYVNNHVSLRRKNRN